VVASNPTSLSPPPLTMLFLFLPNLSGVAISIFALILLGLSPSSSLYKKFGKVSCFSLAFPLSRFHFSAINYGAELDL
jgi:hypothetical protein